MNRRTALLALWMLVLASFASQQLWTQTEKAQTEKKDVPEPSIKVGDEAPDFTLVDQNGQKVTLSSFRGKKNVALAFYIFAFTGG
jgi:cytochrome oxidase Cu insertion factor (SCO1/SenC/PrrC family)